MRVLFVNAGAAFQGGIEANVHMSAVGLARQHGASVGLVWQSGEGRADFLAPFEMAERRSLGEVAGLARAWGADVVYVHKVESLEGVDWGGLRVVRMIHDHDLYCQRRHRYLPGTLEACGRRASWVGCARCGAVVERGRAGGAPLAWRTVSGRLADVKATAKLAGVLVASAFMASEVRLQGVPADRVTTIPLGVEEDGWQPADGGSRRLLYVGQVVRTKGLDVLLEALAQMGGGVELDVAGEGPQRGEFERRAQELGVASGVRWHGRLGVEALRELRRVCLAVVMPHRWPEPFGLVGIEAMRAGRAVVASDAGGVREWLTPERTGRLVKAGSVGGLAQVLGDLFSEPARAVEMGARGREEFERRFTAKRYIDALHGYLGGRMGVAS
jgi:glycosyltransferase involved in cell wall biosynthesis